jgi:hypothetical protein
MVPRAAVLTMKRAAILKVVLRMVFLGDRRMGERRVEP